MNFSLENHYAKFVMENNENLPAAIYCKIPDYT